MQVGKRFKNNNDCSKAVIFPQFKAEILCDYINVDNDISEVSPKNFEIKCTIIVLNLHADYRTIMV